MHEHVQAFPGMVPAVWYFWSEHMRDPATPTSVAFHGLRIWSSENPKERACSATIDGRAMLLFPRPLGRPGCVTTAVTYRADSLGCESALTCNISVQSL